MAKRGRGNPKFGARPVDGTPKLGAQPDSYKTKYPVWRFRSFDWDGPWGMGALFEKNWRKHIESHLANFETMTWAEIESAAGGKKDGTNSHPLPRDKFSRNAIARLKKRESFQIRFFL